MIDRNRIRDLAVDTAAALELSAQPTVELLPASAVGAKWQQLGGRMSPGLLACYYLHERPHLVHLVEERLWTVAATSDHTVVDLILVHELIHARQREDMDAGRRPDPSKLPAPGAPSPDALEFLFAQIFDPPLPWQDDLGEYEAWHEAGPLLANLRGDHPYITAEAARDAMLKRHAA